jgi:branched-subunit amino acid ABC-type transport system permease component
LITSLQLAFGMTLFAAASSLIAVGLTSDTAAETAVLFSALLATVNALLALWLSHIGATRTSTKAFFGAVLGGMLLRMGTTLAGFVIGLKVLLLPAMAFAAALLTYTGLFIAAEVTLWSRQSFSPRVQS